jgi:glycosyltransferase involved in cell wall biosynthesis
MRTWRPHIVHIQDEVHSFHETRAAIDMAKSAIQIGAKVVVTLHEYHTQLPSVRFTDELVSLADAVIVQDARNGQRCQDRTGRVPAAIGWSPANIDPPPHDVSPVPNRLVTFGLISPGKGFELVYEALKKVRPSHPELSWHIMGPFDPTRNEYHRELKQRLTEPWVTFTGGGTKEMAEIGFRTALASASVMLLPFSDGCSPRRTTLQAAWAFGLPTVTTSPEVPEPGIRSGDNCVLVPGIGASESEQIDAWASAIGSVLSRAELRDVLRRGSLAAAGAHSWSELRSQHEAIYSQVLSSRISKRVSLEH